MANDNIVTIQKPESGTIQEVYLKPDEKVNLDFNLDDSASIDIVGADINVTFPDGTQIVFVSLGLMLFSEDSPEFETADGSSLTPNEFLSQVGLVTAFDMANAEEKIIVSQDVTSGDDTGREFDEEKVGESDKDESYTPPVVDEETLEDYVQQIGFQVSRKSANTKPSNAPQENDNTSKKTSDAEFDKKTEINNKTENNKNTQTQNQTSPAEQQAKAARQTLEEENEKLGGRISELESEGEELFNAAAELETEIQDLKTEQATLSEENDTLRGNVSDLEATKQQLENNISEVEGENEELSETVQEQEETITEQQEELESSGEGSGIGEVLDFNVELVQSISSVDESGAEPIVYGGGGSEAAYFSESVQLSDELITVDSAYDSVTIYADDPSMFTETYLTRVLRLDTNVPEGFVADSITIKGLPSGYSIVGETLNPDGSYTVSDVVLNDLGQAEFDVRYEIPDPSTATDINGDGEAREYDRFDIDIDLKASFDPASGYDTPVLTEMEASKTLPVMVMDALTNDEMRFTTPDGEEGVVLNTSQNGNVIIGSNADHNIFGGRGSDNVITQAGNDTIDAGAGDDTISSGNGEDSIIAGAGSDYYDAGTGNDTYDATAIEEDISVNLLNANPNGEVTLQQDGVDKDTLVNFENITGGLGDDIITGNNEDNILSGGEGDDTLSGQLGDDTLDGGLGSNTADYSYSSDDLTLDFNDAVAGEQTFNAGAGDTDVLRNMSGIITGSGDDSITGDGQDNFVSTGDGIDTVIASAGNDTLHGGQQFDTLDYSAMSDDATIDLSSVDADNYATASIGGGKTDLIQNFQRIITGDGDDSLTGDDFDNQFKAGAGSDTIDGGLGSDRAMFDSTGNLTVDLINGTATGEGDTDQLTSIEDVQVDGDATTVITNNDDNTLWLGNGNDTVIGSAGNDELNGGGGVNTISYETATDDVTIRLSDAGDPSDVNNGSATGASIGSDTLNRFRHVIGSDHDDTIYDSDEENSIDGGDGNDVIYNISSSIDTIKGGSGFDRLDYSATSDNLQVDFSSTVLRDGENLVQVSVDGGGNDDFIDSIESFVGSTGNDSIIGSGSGEEFYGDGGNDTIRGQGGDDYINGGSGNDRLFGGTGNNVLDGGGGGYDSIQFLDLSNGISFDAGTLDADGYVTADIGSGETTRFRSYDDVVGSNYDDTMIDSDSNGRFYAANGDDFIRMNGGDDFVGLDSGDNDVDGGSGRDTLSYTGASSGVTMDIQAGTASHNNGNDVFAGFEEYHGSNNNDRIDGSAGDDHIRGRQGSDTIYGDAGDDTLDGDDGSDLVSYEYASGGVVIDLENGTADDGMGGTDTLYEFERAMGSSHNDSITGDDSWNVLLGEDGDDTLDAGDGGGDVFGGDGNDSIIGGGTGNHLYNGQAGSDTLDYSAVDRIEARLQLEQVEFDDADGDTMTDTVRNIETLVATDGDDEIQLVGAINFNVENILAGDGDDDILTDASMLNFDVQLNGGGGNDSLTIQYGTLADDGSDMAENISNIETLDIIAADYGNLTIDASDVVNMTDGNNTLDLHIDSADSGNLNIQAGSNYSMSSSTAGSTTTYLFTHNSDASNNAELNVVSNS